MIILSSKDLDKHGISHQSASKLLFRGRTFIKGQAFAAHLRSLAIELAQENTKVGQPSLVIDYESHVTLWRLERSSVDSQPMISDHPSQPPSPRRASAKESASRVAPKVTR